MQRLLKCIFQKPPDDETIIVNENLVTLCGIGLAVAIALGLEPNEVIAENVKKLEARYPGGAFDVHYSENRKEGDL